DGPVESRAVASHCIRPGAGVPHGRTVGAAQLDELRAARGPASAGRQGIHYGAILMNEITLTINGRQVTASVEPRMLLADFLRERIGAKSVHLGCEHGVCGACTILLNGQTARSCIALAVECDGAQITTLEGLRDDPVMDALCRGFHTEHGLQC